MKLRLALSCVLAVVITVPALGQVQKKDVAGIRNYSRVDASVGCGGATDPSAIGELKKEGYVSIINLRLPTEDGANVEGERAATQAAGLKYIHLPFNAAMPDTKVVDSFLAAVADRSNQPVYIHCASASRVGGMWMIKRVLQDQWPMDKALAEAQVIGLASAPLTQFATDYINSHKKN
jgi:uncharacterized protein (TIGR01244 family)